MFTTAGLDYNNNVIAGNQAVLPLYIGLISNDFTESPSLTNDDIGTAIIEQTAYNETQRQPYQFNANSLLGVINNSENPASFTMNADNTLTYGTFLTTEPTQSTNGTLIAVFKFASAITRNSNELLTIVGNWNA